MGQTGDEKRDTRVSCGLCKKYVDGDWDEHCNSEEHQQKLKNLGGINALTQRRIAIDRLKTVNPGMAKIAKNLADSVDKKMENVLTGKKGYNIYNPDDLEKQDGFITPEGEWYSCDPVYHAEFAYDYVKKFNQPLLDANEELAPSLQLNEKKIITAKEILIDSLGWTSVTVGLTDIYIQPGEKITYAQKKTLKRWLKKFKHPFHINKVLVNDEFHDFFSE